MGFALSMEEVLAALGDVGVSQAMPRRLRRVLVVAQDEDAYGPAIKVAEALRLGGEAAELLLTRMDASLQLQQARRSGVAALVMVRPDGSSERHWVGDGR
jgi:histidyl-tRNA synthetase